MKNVSTSMFNTERCYVYNKAMAKHFDSRLPLLEKGECLECDMVTPFDLIRDWADARGIYEHGDPKTQYLKLMEEAGELGRAILKENEDEQVDAIGDMVVVLTNLSELLGLSIEDCIESAYEVISKRTGKMKNGTFVKDN
jgi:NTP pyrophosphatase (non-canonical NTP hydrolase)